MEDKFGSVQFGSVWFGFGFGFGFGEPRFRLTFRFWVLRFLVRLGVIRRHPGIGAHWRVCFGLVVSFVRVEEEEAVCLWSICCCLFWCHCTIFDMAIESGREREWQLTQEN